ncbi:MAG: hypothetical protein JEZ00_21810 [Anaerolineaceae bacterium]|nr:hypothetical protein [Anaerolineaceae bacterium]
MAPMDLTQLLKEVNQNGGFLASLVTDQEGFAIASASTHKFNPDIQAAVIGLFQRATVQATEQLGESISSEFTLYYENGNLLVCRPFVVKKLNLSLAFLIPGKKIAYRRLMKQTITAIQNSFEF